MDKERTRVYLASYFNLGFPDFEQSLAREKRLVRWLDSIRHDAKALYLLGDIFDYWYEYKRVVPRGFTRFLGKISEFSDNGIPVYFFTGNHDIWVFDYLPRETGVILHTKPLQTVIDGKTFFIGHGDGLGSHDRVFKLLKSFFTSKVAQWFYSKIHPNLTIGFANRWSQHSRASKPAPTYRGEQTEWLIQFARQKIASEPIDFFVFGHRHLAINIMLNEKCQYVNLGDWLTNFTYAVFDGQKIDLLKFE